ncbi:MAG TPA: YfhO family protein, partial [Chloroflexota bacterium]|nr:YfhO family protein [Chloroflexota bacterium]
AIKHVEGLTPNLPLRFGFRGLDGYDGGVLPLTRFNTLKQLFPVQGPVVDDGRLRLQLKSAPDPRLLGWLNVRWLVMDRLRDQWIDNVYYDLAVSQELAPGTPLTLTVSPSFAATGLGVFARGTSSSSPQGTLTVQAGTATQTLSMGVAAPPLQTLKTDTDPTPLGLWRASLNAPTTVDRLTLTWQGSAPLVLRSLSLIDGANGNNQTVVISPAYQITFLGDVKIYENHDTLPRAFLVDGLAVASGPGAVVDRLKDPRWRAQDVAVSAAGDGPSRVAPFQERGPPGQVRWVVDRPEEISLETNATGPRMLVLTDSYYPGWTVTVDGLNQPIVPVDILFRGVRLPSGEHQVVFRYQPTSWRLGLLLSALGMLGAVVGLIVSRH